MAVRRRDPSCVNAKSGDWRYSSLFSRDNARNESWLQSTPTKCRAASEDIKPRVSINYMAENATPDLQRQSANLILKMDLAGFQVRASFHIKHSQTLNETSLTEI